MEVLDNYHFATILIANAEQRAPHLINNVGMRFFDQKVRELFAVLDDGNFSLKTIAHRVGAQDEDTASDDGPSLVIV